jgi:hypothetical protein
MEHQKKKKKRQKERNLTGARKIPQRDKMPYHLEKELEKRQARTERGDRIDRENI